MRTLVALSALVCFTPVAAAGIFHAEGTFLAGTPVSHWTIDACGNQGATDGLDSSCIDLPAVVAGRAYDVRFVGTGLSASRVCFYDELQFMACYEDADPAAFIPPGARKAAFTSMASTQVEWTFDV